MDALRLDKKQREETFRTLVTGLKEVVIGAQRELELKDFDWSMKGSGTADRTKAIKEELETIKKTIVEKIKSDKEELKVHFLNILWSNFYWLIRGLITQKTKTQKLEELLTETQSTQKKYEEYEAKFKDKDIKIGQLTNFSNSLKIRIQTQQKLIEDLQKQARPIFFKYSFTFTFFESNGSKKLL